MTKEELLKKYEEWVLKMSAYDMALAIIGVDKQTVAPKAGNEYRDYRTSILAGEAFSIQTDPEMKEVLEALLQEELEPDTKRAVELYYKNMMNVVSIPKDFFVEHSNLVNESYNAWLEAKTKDDYSIFAPYLAKVIEDNKKIYAYRNSDKPLYDQMLDDYEPGMTQEKYDAFFDKVKNRLVPLIQKVVNAKQVETDFLFEEYPVEEQKAFSKDLLKYLHFDSDWGYQNETEHPFTSWTCENDCRTTTKYLLNNLPSAILSTVHEVGHATYEHDIDPKYDGMILSNGVSSGMHESQSRLFENYLGRTLSFWKANYPTLQKYFPEQLGNISLEKYVDAINASAPSLIRTEADELTYPMHILIRYEIEKGLFNGTIPVEKLNETWKEMYKKYLGIEVPNDRDGILQDVHWSDGSFGYFPTYALGSAFSAQFMKVMRKEIDVDNLLENNKFDEIISWLKENIHQYGCRYTAEEILVKATGEPFNPDYYLDYLEEKYTKLYHLG